MIRPISLLAVAVAVVCASLAAAVSAAGAPRATYDIVIRGGTVYDGSGHRPYVADVAIQGDRIAAIGPKLRGRGAQEIDAQGHAVAPGFINMLAHPEESLIVDGRGLSDLVQGVTLEVLGEDSMGPLTPQLAALAEQRQGDIHYPATWSTLGQYMDMLQTKGIAPNVAVFVGAGTVRTNLLGEADVQPTADQLAAMQGLVQQAMEEGALGLTDALSTPPTPTPRRPS